MPDVAVHYVAVLVVSLVFTVVGAIWYTPAVFGRAWMHAIGKTERELVRGNMGIVYLTNILANIVTAYVLAHFVAYLSADTLVEGMVTGFWVWLGFVAAIGVQPALFEGRKKVYFINMGYNLVSLLIAGAVLAVWR